MSQLSICATSMTCCAGEWAASNIVSMPDSNSVANTRLAAAPNQGAYSLDQVVSQYSYIEWSSPASLSVVNLLNLS